MIITRFKYFLISPRLLLILYHVYHGSFNAEKNQRSFESAKNSNFNNFSFEFKQITNLCTSKIIQFRDVRFIKSDLKSIFDWVKKTINI